MQLQSFKEILAKFQDPNTELVVDKDSFIVSVNGVLIDGRIKLSSGEVSIQESDDTPWVDANRWVLDRLANMKLLANRLKECIQPLPHFISPAANLHPTLELQAQTGQELIATHDALGETLRALDSRSPLETNVLYITSDAGEGKTIIINQLALDQAERFKKGASDFLVVPIPLGGRNFLRFDDITVGALQNRYRFPFLYYDSFIALVRMGVIIPAFDGFEEMFVENSTGEALSAMGLLVEALNSSGTLIIAARRAYFEFENLRLQEKLYRTISDFDVGFLKLELERWDERQFIEYGISRDYCDVEELYASATERLGYDHSLLTRPVLVKRLIDIALKEESLNDLIAKISTSGVDFFSVFVQGIIEREVVEKWIDRSGEAATPLLSVGEHEELLSEIALAMWENSVDYLKLDYLKFVTEFYAEKTEKNPFQTQQIVERIRTHALIVVSANARDAICFDHDEFRCHYLGEAIASRMDVLNDHAKRDVQTILRKGLLSGQTQRSLALAIKRCGQKSVKEVVDALGGIASLEGQASFAHENCCSLAIKLLNGEDIDSCIINELSFGENELRDKKLQNIEFSDCYFASSSLEHSMFENCNFTNCVFAQLRVHATSSFKDVSLQDCQVESLYFSDRDFEIWNPNQVDEELVKLGITVQSGTSLEVEVEPEPQNDQELYDVVKLIRYFMRSTTMSESVIRMKISEGRGNEFIDETIPTLLEKGIFVEVEGKGGTRQRRFRLKMGLGEVNSAIALANGSFTRFLEEAVSDGA